MLLSTPDRNPRLGSRDVREPSARLAADPENPENPGNLNPENYAARPLDLLQGTLDLLILRTLNLGPMHGWGISQRIQQLSAEVLRVNQGSLYPALQRLESAGWVSSEWGASENNRQAKFYRLTKAGPEAAPRRNRVVASHE